MSALYESIPTQQGEKQIFIVALAGATIAREPGQWRLGDDLTSPLAKQPYMPMMGAGRVLPLSAGAPEYDMAANDGFKCVGAWIDAAADAVGRSKHRRSKADEFFRQEKIVAAARSNLRLSGPRARATVGPSVGKA